MKQTLVRQELQFAADISFLSALRDEEVITFSQFTTNIEALVEACEVPVGGLLWKVQLDKNRV